MNLKIFDNNFLQALVVVITLDVLFGIARAGIEKNLNSTIGIDGIIRKISMLSTIVACIILDNLINVDLIGFFPNEVKDFIHIQKIGISELFCILYILFETLSIFKNMYKCKLPIPKVFKKWLEKMLKEFTSEVK